jgi:actin-related protein
MDLVQTISAVLSVYPNKTINALLSNILVVGGGSVIPGLKERLERDLRRESPVGSTICVKIGKGGVNGAFLGMQYIGRH